MNEQLQTALSEIINKTLDGVDASVGFLQAELPDYIYQLLLWYGVKSALECLAGLLFIAFCVKFPFMYAKWCQKQYESGSAWTRFRGRKDSDTTSEIYDVRMLFCALLIIPFGFAIAALNIEWLQIWIAPKVWLIEYASSIVK